VHLDFPLEVVTARFPDPSILERSYGKERYRSESRAYPGARDLQQAIEMINKSERPVLIAGHGLFVRKACDALMQAAEKHEMAVVGSGPVRGHFPDDHRLSGSMANEALMKADLVIFVGQYSMPVPEEWTLPPGVKTIRVHPEQGDLGRNWPIDLGIVSDEKVFMEALANGLPPKKRDSWVGEFAAAKRKWEQALHPFVLCKEVHDFLYKGDIDPKQTVTGWGGNMIGFGCMRWLRANRPGQEITVVYQFGPMGPDLAMMMGASVAVQRGVGPHAAYQGAPVVCVTGDAGMAYSLFELDTFVKYKLPVICIVYNNDCWGTFTMATETPNALHMYMFQENLRYDKMAEFLGTRGEYVRTPEELRAALKRSYDAAVKQGHSTLINCQGIKEFNLADKYPPGLDFAPEPGIGAIRH
jgi:thiamine pyrophosphate-dependent acetolactate synthase large subunit-like protein